MTTITSIFPNNGIYWGGVSVTIRGKFPFYGTNYIPTISFGTQNASSVSVISATQITCTTPSIPSLWVNGGQVNIYVTFGTTTTKSSIKFTCNPITIYPIIGPVDGAYVEADTELVITGCPPLQQGARIILELNGERNQICSGNLIQGELTGDGYTVTGALAPDPSSIDNTMLVRAYLVQKTSSYLCGMIHYGTVNFRKIGTKTWSVPPTVKSINVIVVGAGGNGSGSGGNAGGAGCITSTSLNVSQLKSLVVSVGGVPLASDGTRSTNNLGAGGGSSGIYILNNNNNSVLVISGGGGGGGGYPGGSGGNNFTASGGAAGGGGPPGPGGAGGAGPGGPGGPGSNNVGGYGGLNGSGLGAPFELTNTGNGTGYGGGGSNGGSGSNGGGAGGSYVNTMYVDNSSVTKYQPAVGSATINGAKIYNRDFYLQIYGFGNPNGGAGGIGHIQISYPPLVASGGTGGTGGTVSVPINRPAWFYGSADDGTANGTDLTWIDVGKSASAAETAAADANFKKNGTLNVQTQAQAQGIPKTKTKKSYVLIISIIAVSISVFIFILYKMFANKKIPLKFLKSRR